MKLGQGCHRRMHLDCRVLAILATAIVLLGAVGSFAQTAEAQRSNTDSSGAQLQTQTDDSLDAPRRDPHVQPVSFEAGPTRPQFEPSAETDHQDRAIVKVYKARDLLEKLRQEEPQPEETTDEQLKQMLVGYLRYFAGELPVPNHPFADSSQPKSRTSRAQFAWHGDQLVVSAREAAHQRLAKEIETRRAHGFRQVTLEVRLLQGSPSLCMGAEQESAEDEGVTESSWRDRWMLFRQEFANAESMPPLPSRVPDDLDETDGVDASQRASASVTSGHSDPIVYQFADDAQMRDFMQVFQNDDAVNSIVQAPKVTLFNGQTAEISDVSQRPFVTDVKKIIGDNGEAYQPVIQVFWEGTKIQLRPQITADGHRVSCRFQFASIDGCETFRPPQFPDAANTRIQHPVVSMREFECAIDIPNGRTLLIGGLFPCGVSTEVEQGAFSRMLRLEPKKVFSRQVTYIAITPRTIMPNSVR